jgi:YaiO family outer membrane protein
MKHTAQFRFGWTCISLLLFLAPRVTLAQDEVPEERQPRGTIDVGGEYQRLTPDLGTWKAFYIRGVFLQDAHNTWNAEITRRAEFGDQGTYFTASDTHILNEDWYMSLAAGASAGGFFLPQYRIDAAMNKKWRKQRNLVTSLGYMHAKAKDVHRDDMIEFGAAYYWQRPWTLEGAVHLNISHPGPALSESQFIALTRGRDRKHLVTLRVEFGTEAYQLVGPSTVLTQFQSQAVSLTWRQWTKGPWGFNVMPEYYHSPAYHRGGITLGIFREF